ncbi:hypothetical protein I317_04137 [Kwoniella heveanensis CBS 569]|nr:hypothetical protein I317_04137 [Kwoniella heveanensis CBS 569]
MILISSIHNPPLTLPPPTPNAHFISRTYRLRRFVSFDSSPSPTFPGPAPLFTHQSPNPKPKPKPTGPGKYPPPVPNLELHSAAASGNVGLVQYALTHGQPVNSVLHGVLPLHAACSGGSVSVVRMLLECGADVNAPRLPRRYSDGKRGTAPSVGTAGSTPLHFAAANGHAPIVQMLLASGADPTKPDKNGNTAEDLATINGHEDVVRVLHAFEHLQSRDAAHSDRAEPSSPSGSTSQLPEEDEGSSVRHHWIGSRKGKERAFSLSSSRSDGVIKVKSSLEGLLRRGTRHSSGVFSAHSGDDSRSELSVAGSGPGQGPGSSSIPRISTYSDMSSNVESDQLQSPAEIETPGSPSPKKGISVPLAPEDDSNNSLTRITSGHSSTSNGTSIVLASPPHSAGLTPPTPRGRHGSTSSHRPSLPSILEKAVHPGQAFRAALRHHGEKEQKVQFSPDPSTDSHSHEADTHHAPSSGGFFRGRRKSHDPDLNNQHHGKKHGKHGIKSFFRRSHSPPSRSPSPPQRKDAKPIDAEELEEGIQRLKRASLDLERIEDEQAGNVTEEGSQDEGERRRSWEKSDDDATPQPKPTASSAPATKTKFFPDSPTLGPPRLAGRSNELPSTASSPGGRPRTGSEVIAPSPLANEWAHDTDDSDSSLPHRGIRRVRTEVIKSPSSSYPTSPLSPDSPYTSPPSPRGARPRSATYTGGLPSPVLHTLPKGLNPPRPLGLGWEDDVDLRKVAASGLIRRESQRRQEEAEAEAGDEIEGEDEEEYHDAVSPDPQAGDADALGSRTEDEIESTPTPQSELVLNDPPETEDKPDLVGHIRGDNAGSGTNESSRLSTPAASLRHSSTSDDVDDSGYRQGKNIAAPLPTFTSVVDNRPRGKSVSSVSSSTSGMGYSFAQTVSTPSTSLTPPSALSLLPSGPVPAFPPVPENEVVSNPPSHRRTMTQRTISSHAEAKELVKQNETDILQLAQLPPSLDSSRSLAEQLAAYGENVAIQQQFAAMERRSSQGLTPRGGESEDGESYFSAESGWSRGSSRSSEKERRVRLGSAQGTKPRALSNPLLPLTSIDAPRSSMPAINTIYDKRADAYRKHMATLSAAQPILPSATRHAQSRARRQRAASSHEMWLDAGPMNRRPTSSQSHTSMPFSVIDAEAEEVARHPHISGPMPVVSNPVTGQRARKSSAGSSTSHHHGQATSSGHGRAHTAPRPTSKFILPSSASQHISSSMSTAGSGIGPTPIADILSTRFQGLSTTPTASSFATPALVASQLRSTSGGKSGIGSGSGSGLGSGHGPAGAHQHNSAAVGGAGYGKDSPYVSIFSHRYAATPLNEDDSDDEEQERREYTVIENDWRGGHVVRPDELGLTTSSEGKKGKWGLKKMGLGRKS